MTSDLAGFQIILSLPWRFAKVDFCLVVVAHLVRDRPALFLQVTQATMGTH